MNKVLKRLRESLEVQHGKRVDALSKMNTAFNAYVNEPHFHRKQMDLSSKMLEFREADAEREKAQATLFGVVDALREVEGMEIQDGAQEWAQKQEESELKNEQEKV